MAFQDPTSTHPLSASGEPIDHECVVAGVREAVGSVERLPLHAPIFPPRAQKYVAECIASGWVSSAGPFVDRFEQALAEFLGAEHVVAVNTGTAALHAALEMVEVRAGDVVACPSLTFVATANAIAYTGATPLYFDVEERTFGLDPALLRGYAEAHFEVRDGRGYDRRVERPIGAIVPMHTFGHPMDIRPLIEVAERYSIPLVEDAAESLGSHYDGRHCGTLGAINATSFNGNKAITTGGGGALITNDPELARRVRHRTSTAKQPHAWEYVHDEVGYNYRMPGLCAALGLAQLEAIDEILTAKKTLAARYAEAFRDVAGVRILDSPSGSTSNYWLNALVLDDPAERDSLLQALHDDGIEARAVWRPMHELAIHDGLLATPLATTERLARTTINLPSSPELGGLHF